MEVEHVKEHRTKKEKTEMSHFEKFVTEGNEKTDELAKAGALLDEGFVAEARAKTMQQECEKRCMQPCSMQPAFTVLWKNGRTVKSSSRSLKNCGHSWTRKKKETKHRTEWCAEANKYRCMVCGRGSKYKKMPGKCTRPKYLLEFLESGSEIWEVANFV